MVQHSILQITDYGAPYPGNFLASLQALDPLLRLKGWRQIYMFSERAQEREWLAKLHKQGLSIYILPESTLLDRALYIRDVARKENASILHAHFTRNDLAAIVAFLLLLLTGRKVRVVWHVHSPWLAGKSAMRRIKDFIKYRMLTRIANVIVVSKGGMQSMKERGLPIKRTEVIFNGIDIERATTPVTSRETMRRQLGIDADAKVILMFGRDAVIKGVDVALLAFADIAVVSHAV